MGLRVWENDSQGLESVAISISRFLSRPFIIRVPFFLMLSFNRGTLKQKGQKGTTPEPRFHGLRFGHRV